MGFTLALALLVMSELDMTWNAPPACPDEATVRARVGEFLQSSSVNADSVRARVTVEGGEAGWTADLELTVGDLTEHRVLQDRSCDVVATASAFVVAVAVDPQLLTSEPVPVVDPVPHVAAQSSEERGSSANPSANQRPEQRPDPPRPIPAQRASERPSPARAISGAARAGVVLDVGASAGAAVGPQMTGSVLFGPWRIEVPVLALFGLPVQVGPGTVQTTVLAAGVRGCRELGRSKLRVPLCVGAEGGRFRARAQGFDQVGSANAAWFAPTADLGLNWAFSRRIGLRAGAGAVIPVLRPRFEVDNVGLVHRAGPVAFRAELGIEARFP